MTLCREKLPVALCINDDNKTCKAFLEAKMTCLFSNDFSNVTKSSNLAVRHFKGEGPPPPLWPTRV